MGRGLARRPLSCEDHPHRPAVDRCDECRRLFCGDCLERAGSRRLCRNCLGAQAIRDAAIAGGRGLDTRVADAWRRWSREFVAAGLLLVVLATIGLSSARSASVASRRAFADVPGVIARISTERYCAGGHETLSAVAETGPTPGGKITETGAAVAEVLRLLPDQGDDSAKDAIGSSTANHFDPMNLVRSRGPASLGWRSRSEALPQQVGFELRERSTVDRVAFWHARSNAPSSWAHDVALLLSVQGPDSGFRLVGRWTLGPTSDPQQFALEVSAPARFVRICLLSRHGSSEFVSLGGFALGVMTGDLDVDSRPVIVATGSLGSQWR